MILVEADVDGEWDSSIDWLSLAREAGKAAVTNSRFAQLTHSPLRAEISVKFTTNAEVRQLNAAYRNKDKPTNVLSFPMIDSELLDPLIASGSRELLLGDVVLAGAICAEEADERGIAVEHHAVHLVVHGVLHLLGYDHETGEDDAEAMEAIERAALASIGIKDPYQTEVRT